MGLRLLGPVELVLDRRSLDLGGPRQRIVLSMLGLNANRVVPVEQLVDALWDRSPPSTARGQVQICISALRRIFADAGHGDAIKTRPPGYLLEIAPSELDSLEFTALVAAARTHSDAGRATEAATTLRGALALWRGSALSGVPSDLVQRGAALWEDRRLAAVEELIRLDLELGRHEEISGDLGTLVEEHPLRERLHGFLMLALYRAGRQAEALEVGRRARSTLIEEVGIEPGQELQDLERAILNRDPKLSLPTTGADPVAKRPSASPAPEQQPVVPQQLPASISDFTGREGHLDEIRQLVSGGAGGYGMPIVAISGKGGVGKSSLAVRVAHELSSEFPDGQLYADLRTPHGDDHTANLLARFLRALGVAGTAVPDDVEERAELYRSRLSGRRLLLVLDDVSSEHQVRPLLPGSPTCAVVTTSRSRLSGLSGAHWIDVGMFDVEQSVELLAKIVGRARIEAEQASVVELVTFCGGLPLALRIAGARLASRPHWRVDGLVRRLRDEARRLDELAHHGLELRSNIGLTYKVLDVQEQRLFRLFALVQAPDFPGWTAAALLDTSLVDAEDVLESLVDAQLLDVVKYPDSVHVRYRFHDLIRVYAGEKLVEVETADERAAALTRVLGAWLALAEEAHRREYGGDYTILHGTAPRWRDPDGEAAESIGNPMDWWECERRALVAAVRQAADAGLDEMCWDLALTSVTLFEAKGYFDDWLECTRAALAATEAAGNRVGYAAMRYSLGTLHMFQTRLADADECFTTALDIFRAEGDEHGCALVLRNAAHVDGLRGDIRSMLAKYDESLATMRVVGDRVGEAHILRSMAKFRMDEGDTAKARELLDDALAICQEVRCLRTEAQVVHRFAELHLATGQIDEARQALHRVLRIVRDTGDRIGEVHALYGLGLLRHREGRLDNAETTLVHALDLARRVGEQLIEAKALYALGEIALARGGDSTGVTHLVEARRLFDELGSALWHARTLVLLSEIHTNDGDMASAGEKIEQAVRLLSEVDSKESAQLSAGLRGARSVVAPGA
ncbi:BTAD domain-containing putative transcriptional regulator [Umezawaea sp. Da 62-37]|uniref:AfsR/SARP family transcriptional regulator n=1 Tax=Umezawaea sp. Da 62-37 TaxID=3075927 RepID=UPI0028F74DC5|nr:BTAD domain-containing putative transcriptional regulator [Umezawaea sp. Da 62-37]WNV86436.1 BTAD domain-containing putative transcriptional regulator [Umezawaea sp. Da 62-37]